MKRAERNEYNYIRRYEKQFDLGPGTTLTIRTDGSPEYKRALHDLYTSFGFHPASVRVDRSMYDDKERVIYICVDRIDSIKRLSQCRHEFRCSHQHMD